MYIYILYIYIYFIYIYIYYIQHIINELCICDIIYYYSINLLTRNII